MGRMRTQFGIWGQAGSLLLAAMVVAGIAPMALGDEVLLRRRATVDESVPITLNDIAELEGDYAHSLRDVVVVDQQATAAKGEWVTIELGEVRQRLMAQGVRMGALSLSGNRCDVRVGVVELARPAAEAAAPLKWEEYSVADVAGATDVPAMIVGLLADQLELTVHDRIRVRFDAVFTDALAKASGKRVGVASKSTASGGAALFGLTAYGDDGSITDVWTVRVEAQVWRTVVRMKRTVSRRSVMRAGDIESIAQWVGVGETALHDATAVVGFAARMRLSEGELVREGQLEAPIVIRRGDLVQVHCLSGGLVVRGRGRAQSAGRAGELIECKLDDASRSFLARVDGPGRVVMEAIESREPVAGGK